jgi:hypothetical protein
LHKVALAEVERTNNARLRSFWLRPKDPLTRERVLPFRSFATVNLYLRQQSFFTIRKVRADNRAHNNKVVPLS